MGKRAERFSSMGGTWGGVEMRRLPSRLFSGGQPLVCTMTLLALKPLASLGDMFSVIAQPTETGSEESTGSLANVLGGL